MHYIKQISGLILIFYMTQACISHQHSVGEGPVGNDNVFSVYDKMKKSYLFWGIFPLQKEQLTLPSDNNYQIKSSFQFEDALISILTAGIYAVRTVKVIVFKREKINGCPLKINDKITVTINKEVIFGKIVGMDAKTKKVSFIYNNIYGEKQVKSLHYRRLVKIDEVEYVQRTREWQAEINKYKFKTGQYVEWSMNNSMEFGEIVKLNNRTHKATIELTTIFDDITYMQVPFLDIITIDKTDFDERMENWNLVKEDYVFFVGEKVKWKSDSKTIPATINLINKSNHKANIIYRDSDGTEKKKTVSVLDLIKLN